MHGPFRAVAVAATALAVIPVALSAQVTQTAKSDSLRHPSTARPSTVATSLPMQSTARSMHAYTVFLSTNTVHAPHEP
jgi:hypothetical protein